jgi:hypothetical protein
MASRQPFIITAVLKGPPRKKINKREAQLTLGRSGTGSQRR